MSSRSIRWARLRVRSTIAESKARLRRAGDPVARPLLHLLYRRVDARTAAAVTALQSSQRAALDDLSEQLELTRAAAVSSAAGARALRREHDELTRRLAEVEARLTASETGAETRDGRGPTGDVSVPRPPPSG